MRVSGRSCVVCVALVAALATGCATTFQSAGTRTTKRDKTKKGAAIGAASGAVLGAVFGDGELDEVIAGAALGAGIGAGVGSYMDRQEEKLARIPGTTVERVEDNLLLVRFDSDILFNVNSSTLSTGAHATLDEAAAVFMEYPKTGILAQGHTDSTGTRSYNQSLSEKRAQAVASYLIGEGLNPTRIATEGFGESSPVADNATAEGRRRNRRVDLLLKAKVR